MSRMHAPRSETVAKSALRDGFTLIQISIMLTVASLVMVTLLPSTQTNLAAKSAAVTRLNAVLLSLRQYEAANGNLPCPGDASQPIGSASYGVAAANAGPSTNCAGGVPSADYTDAANNVAIGLVPVRALGLSDDYALDPYGRDITYAVDTNATSCGWSAGSLTGKLSILDNGVAHNTVAALISHGADGHGAWIPLTGSSGTAVRLNGGSTDADQLTNAHVDLSFNPTAVLTSFVRKMPTTTFDDLVVYGNPLWNTAQLPQSSPRITSLTVPANGDYESSQSQSLTFTVTYSSTVTVTGTPRLTLHIGGTTRDANYSSGSGTTILTFSYALVTADYAPAPAGISMTASIDLNGGTIMSGSYCLPISVPKVGLTSVDVNALAIYIADTNNHVVRRVMASTGIITTVAGTTVGFSGDNGTATSAQLSNPYSINVDSSGNIFICDVGNARIREVTLSTGIITTVAGNGTAGYNGDSGAATAARIDAESVAVDSAGNIYFGDIGANQVVRKITAPTGVITTVAGTGTAGFGGDGAAATAAKINKPYGVAVDSSGNIYIADFLNYRVREVTAATGFISTVAGNGTAGFTGDGGVSTSAEMNNGPRSVMFDSSGNMYLADSGNNRIRKVAVGTNIITTVAGNGTAGFTGDGAAATSAEMNVPWMVAVDSFGNLYITDKGNNRVRKVTAGTSIITTFAGNGTAGYTGDNGAATAAKINSPQGIAVGLVR